DGPAGYFLQIEHGGDGFGDALRGGERGEVDEEHPVGEAFDKTAGDLQREARLADAARPNERDQPVPGDPLQHLGYLLLAPDERRDLRREVMCNLHRGTVRRAAPASVAVADQPYFPAACGGAGAVALTELAVMLLGVPLDRAHAERQRLRDLPVREAFGNQHADLLLALAQGLQQGL